MRASANVGFGARWGSALLRNEDGLMEPLSTGLIVAALMMAGALAGAFLRKRLSERHFDEETKDIVKLGLGFLTILAALVLGLVISSAKASYDAKTKWSTVPHP
jgi:hypothetical protein